MKATLDIPDGLYRQVKAKSALLGKPVREVTIELYERWLAERPSVRAAQSPEAWLSDWLSLSDAAIGNAPSGPSAREVLQADRARLEPQ
jgi:hypothetical protein